MIAKIIESKTQNASFSRSARYVLDVSGGVDPATWKRTADYVLDTTNSHEGEKVGSVFISNCISTDAGDAALEILATQAQNTRSKTAKHLHIVASFPPGETLTDSNMQIVEAELVKSLGLEDHQRLTAVHLDTDHQHMHILINTVHPKNFRNITPYQSKQHLMDACVKLELVHSLQRTNHGEKANSRTLGADIEAHSGQQSLAGWISREGGSDLIDSLEKAVDWEGIHKELAEFGLEIRPRGAGLVVGVKGDTRLHVKASSLSRSLSANALGVRLGDYKAPSETISKLEPKVAYERQPVVMTKGQVLFTKYTSERAASSKANAAIKSSFSKVYTESRESTRDLFNKKRAIIKANRALTYLTRRTKYRELDADYRATMRGVMAENKEGKHKELTPKLTWKDYLQKEATAGNSDALDSLRKMQKPRKAQDNSISVQTTKEPNAFLFADTKTVAKSGTVRYQLKDGGVIADKTASIEVLKPSDLASSHSLTLAQARFPKEKLELKGTKKFKDKLVELAGKRKLTLKFLDSGLEKKRLALTGKVKTKTQQIKPRGLGR